MSASFEPEVQTSGFTRIGLGPDLSVGRESVLQVPMIPSMDFVQFASEDSMRSLIAHACYTCGSLCTAVDGNTFRQTEHFQKKYLS